MTTIIGGGLGGLTLACALQRQGKPVTVFEAEPHRDSRPQGGVLDMHEESGQAALAACGLTKQFERHIIPAGDEMRVLDKTGKALYEEMDKKQSDRPEVDRLDLRNILIDALGADTIQWGHKLQKAEARGKGFTLTFANGKQVDCEKLVGADGAWSKVRTLLSNVKPTYTGVTFVEFYIHDVETHPDAVATVGKGSLFALQDNKGIIAHRHGDGSIQVYVAVRGPEDALKHATANSLMDTFADWGPSLRGLLQHGASGLVVRGLYALPVGFHWTHRPGVTLLGDAAHLMSPFAGEGANLAMLDGADLAASNDWRVYEQAMWARSREAAADSAENLDRCVAPDGSVALAKLMKSFVEARASQGM